ncbi:Lrp/AsnC family transcriptional regulator [Candidatus Micrarchaeota archaeon]|nr:Lrp/AsnC family transcriptional regulator [Candidatus Micrarchaeota archaeon]
MTKKIKLDKKDMQILHELDYDARAAITDLAKKLGLSVQTTKYRLDNLFSKKVIYRTMPVIDVHKLGMHTYRIYLRLQKATDKDGKKIVEYFVGNNRTMWVVETSGRWDMEIIVLVKTPIEVNAFLYEMKKKVGRYIKNYVITSSIITYHFERNYLTNGEVIKEKPPMFGFGAYEAKLDRIDVGILKWLNENARMTNQEIAEKLGVSFNTIKSRIVALEKKEVIQTYRTFVDLEKIDRTFYKAQINTRGFGEDDEKKMVSFCLAEPTVVYFVKCIGEWDLEIEAEVRDETEFRQLMTKFAHKFDDIIQDYEILHIYKEHKMSYIPMADEMLESMG